MSERKARSTHRTVAQKLEVAPLKGVPGDEAENKKKGVVVNQIELSPKDPIPFEGGAQYSFSNSDNYLPFLNASNNFALQLLEARMKSATQAACIGTKSDYCAGDTMISADSTKDLDQSIIDWFGSMNLKNESIGKLNKKIFESHFQWGNTPIELVKFDIAGEEKRLYVYVHNFLEWRLCVPNPETDICEAAIQSKLFLKGNKLNLTQVKKARKLPIYNPRNTEAQNWITDEKGAKRTLIWYSNFKAGYNYYGMPESVETLAYQVAEYKNIRYNLDGFDNNWTASAILTLTGSVSSTENQRIAKTIIDTHTGDGRRGRVAVLSSEQGMTGTEVEQLDTTTDGSFLEADASWSQKIIFGHKWDAVLAGLVTSSTLGKGAGFLTKIFEIKQTTVIIPAQRDLINEVWVHVFKIAQEWLNLPTDQYNYKIRTSANINALSDVDVTPVVTVDEVREANNLPALEDHVKGKMLVGELTKTQTANSGINPQKEETNVPGK